MFHLLVLLKSRGIRLEEVEAALAQRTSMSGLEEKAARKRDYDKSGDTRHGYPRSRPAI